MMEITFIINVERSQNPNRIDRFTKKGKDFNECFGRAYKHIKMRYKNIYPVVKFTLVNVEFV